MTETTTSTYQRLAERFPASAHKTRKQGGRDLTYVTGEMVVSRLNEVLGFDGWSFEVKDVTVLENEVWAVGKLTVYAGDRVITREQTGGQIINRNRSGEIIEIANDIKGAVTDTLKKTATLIGVGAYLYDEDDRREVEREMAESKRPTSTDRVRAAAVVTGAAPTPIKPPKSEDQLREDIKRGVAALRQLGTTMDDVSTAGMDRADLLNVLNELADRVKTAKAAKVS